MLFFDRANATLPGQSSTWFAFRLRNVRVGTPSSPDLVGLRPRATPRAGPICAAEEVDHLRSRHSGVCSTNILLGRAMQHQSVVCWCCFSCRIAARLDNDTRVADGASRIARRPRSPSPGHPRHPWLSAQQWTKAPFPSLSHLFSPASIDKQIRAELGQEVKERPCSRRILALRRHCCDCDCITCSFGDSFPFGGTQYTSRPSRSRSIRRWDLSVSPARRSEAEWRPNGQ